MKFSFHIAIAFLLSITIHPAYSQGEVDYYQSGYLRFENFIYNENIKTVVIEQENLRLSEPVIELGGTERLVLSFDDLDGDFKNYMYTLIHCDASWVPSNLISNEYLAGFTEDRIINYRSSFNTIQHYTHYIQEIPGREVKPTISGNYIVKVYVEGEPDKPVLTRRMMVLQARTNIEATVRRATVVSDMHSKQEIDFSVIHSGLQLANPFEDVKVVLMQNGRWDNAVTGLKPLFLKENELEYNYEEENTFNGGNEYRMFDLRTVRVYTQFVQQIIEGTDGFSVILVPGVSRSFDRYVTENDINGKFLIRNQDGRDSDLESEYVKVKFTLKHEILTTGNFYVFGALSDWRIGSQNKMEYNYDEGTYETLLYLKQGYYDYQFVFVEDGSAKPDETIVEGNHFETGNDYSILVYYKQLGGRHDQLVGLKRINTR